MEINKYIDHTLLKANSTFEDVEKLCLEAVKYNFFSVCINPYFVKFAKESLKDSDVKVCTVVGFPLGANTIETKVFELKDAISNGADEIDLVMNVGLFKSKEYDLVFQEIQEVRKNTGSLTLKVIIETCYLTEEEKKTATELCVKAGVDFVKTSTGFGTSGANIDDIILMKEITGDKIKIKASGGIKSYNDAAAFIQAGASRLGTSNGVAIVVAEKVEAIGLEAY